MDPTTDMSRGLAHSPLGALPIEVREMIYEQAFGFHQGHIDVRVGEEKLDKITKRYVEYLAQIARSQQPDDDPSTAEDSTVKGKDTQLLRTCRQVYFEGSKILFEKNSLHCVLTGSRRATNPKMRFPLSSASDCVELVEEFVIKAGFNNMGKFKEIVIGLCNKTAPLHWLTVEEIRPLIQLQKLFPDCKFRCDFDQEKELGASSVLELSDPVTFFERITDAEDFVAESKVEFATVEQVKKMVDAPLYG